MRSLVLFGAAALGIAAATPLQTRYAVKETFKVPREFRKVANAPARHLIRLNVALKQSQFEDLERSLYESSSFLLRNLPPGRRA